MIDFTKTKYRFEQTLGKNTLKTSGKHVKLHSRRVDNMSNYTRNEWKTCQTTLETSGKLVKLHSKRVENFKPRSHPTAPSDWSSGGVGPSKSAKLREMSVQTRVQWSQ